MTMLSASCVGRTSLRRRLPLVSPTVAHVHSIRVKYSPLVDVGTLNGSLVCFVMFVQSQKQQQTRNISHAYVSPAIITKMHSAQPWGMYM